MKRMDRNKRKIKYLSLLFLLCFINLLALVSCSKLEQAGVLINPFHNSSNDIIERSEILTTMSPYTQNTLTQKPTPTPKPTPKPAKKPTVTPAPVTKQDFTPPARVKNESLRTYAKRILHNIITANMKDVDKVKAVHDYIVLNTKYDYDNLINNTIPDVSYTAEGVLWKHKAVCNGYAYAFKLFMDLLDINCKVEVGYDLETGVSHAWNIVKLGDNWYQVDTTWDDPIPDQKGVVQYHYFLLTDKILSKDHKWIRSDYPACTSQDYLYYVYKKNIIRSIKDYEKEFIKRYNAGERKITLLYPEEGKPDMHFLLNYDYIGKYENGKYTISWSSEDTWRLGKYTVYSIYMNQ